MRWISSVFSPNSSAIFAVASIGRCMNLRIHASRSISTSVELSPKRFTTARNRSGVLNILSAAFSAGSPTRSLRMSALIAFLPSARIAATRASTCLVRFSSTPIGSCSASAAARASAFSARCISVVTVSPGSTSMSNLP